MLAKNTPAQFNVVVEISNFTESYSLLALGQELADQTSFTNLTMFHLINNQLKIRYHLPTLPPLPTSHKLTTRLEDQAIWFVGDFQIIWGNYM